MTRTESPMLPGEQRRGDTTDIWYSGGWKPCRMLRRRAAARRLGRTVERCRCAAEDGRLRRGPDFLLHLAQEPVGSQGLEPRLDGQLAAAREDPFHNFRMLALRIGCVARVDVERQTNLGRAAWIAGS